MAYRVNFALFGCDPHPHTGRRVFSLLRLLLPAVRRTTHKLHNFQLSLSTAQSHPNSGGTENAEVPTLLGKALLCCSHGNTAAEPGLTPFNGLGEDILQLTNQY